MTPACATWTATATTSATGSSSCRKTASFRRGFPSNRSQRQSFTATKAAYALQHFDHVAVFVSWTEEPPLQRVNCLRRGSGERHLQQHGVTRPAEQRDPHPSLTLHDARAKQMDLPVSRADSYDAAVKIHQQRDGQE